MPPSAPFAKFLRVRQALRVALVRFVPVDPNYAPFALPWLRGLNALPYALVAATALVWMTSFVLVKPPDLRGLPNSLVAFTPMLLLVVAADNLSAAWRPAARIGALAAAMLLGAFVNALVWQPLGCLSVPEAYDGPYSYNCEVFAWSWNKAATFGRVALWGGLFTTLLYFYKRGGEAERALHAEHLRRLNAERQETEARLRSLQAQIEPHFLFNTLAHIQRLAEVQPARGRAMLRDLIDYLRTALPQMREADSTLGRELALARAYLNVQRIRMGERLRVDIDVPERLADARLPPMMLVTLVENAIKHGVGPKREGGTVRIAAQERDGHLEVAVSDDGVGLRIGAGAGLGLANTRARLGTQFGAAASLEIADAAGGGVRAALQLPHVPAGAKGGA